MPSAAVSIAVLLAAVLFAPAEAGAQAVSPAVPASQAGAAAGGLPEDGASRQADAPVPLTLKERLGAKWKDEQRVDNCKVPVEKRGAKPRPDSCAHLPVK
jgi:hypothetical protein